MKWLDRSVGLALLCVVTSGAASAQAQDAAADEASTRFSVPASAPAPDAQKFVILSAPPRRRSAGIAFQPELPPDAGADLPTALTASPQAPKAPATAAPLVDPPLARLSRETAAP